MAELLTIIAVVTVSQMVGALLALLVFYWLFRKGMM